jgi:biopolymer transport protein ExbB
VFELFEKGGPIMWPLLAASVVSVGVVIERLIFMVREKARRDPAAVDSILLHAEKGEIERAIQVGAKSRDGIARVLAYGLEHEKKSASNALLSAANRELKRYTQGLPILDTIITLAPLLGLLGTVTGMIRSFGLLGGAELDAPTVITGGIAEALIATAFGLGIAIVSLIPFNYLNARAEEARHELEDAANHLELHLIKSKADYANITTGR